MTTKTVQFTPGPWEVKPIGKQLYVEAKDGQGFVCDMQINDALGEIDGPRIRADAHLIAAAPAMYEALKDLIGDLGDLHGGSIAELQCHWCGRDYEDQEAGGLCTSDDCPGFKAREALAQAEGR